SANYLLFRDDTQGAKQKLLKIYNKIVELRKKSEIYPEEEDNGEAALSDEVKTQTAKFLIEVDCFIESIELLTEINETVIGLDKQCFVESSPKSININPRAQFYITLLIRMTEELRKEIESTKGVYKVRKVLLIRIKDTSVYYHFPVEISFY
ncbi:unnamed protein product, partial [Sphagnum balticum]